MPRTRFATPSKWATPFVALMIAIVVNILFFNLFKHKEPPKNNTNSQSTQSGVSMLNVLEWDSNSQENFYNYLQTHDPKNYFDSNNPANFSAYLPKDKIVRQVSYTIPQMTIARQIPELPVFAAKPVAAIPHGHYSYLEPKLSIYGVYPSTKSFVNSQRNVLVLTGSGKAINNLTLPLPKNILVSKPTIIKISSKLGVERLTLEQSSGNTELDKVALTASRSLKHHAGNLSYTFYWPLVDKISQTNLTLHNENKK